jgi:hypothetical protein
MGAAVAAALPYITARQLFTVLAKLEKRASRRQQLETKRDLKPLRPEHKLPPTRKRRATPQQRLPV